MKPAENYSEEVIIVDDSNEFVKYTSRKEMRQHALTHQGSFIFVISPDGKICTHLRHKDKAWCGGYWTTVFGGCVGQGETYLTNAQKEIQEEAGLQSDGMVALSTFRYASTNQNVWGQVFWIPHNGADIQFQKEEIDDVKWQTIAEIVAQKDRFAPDGYKALDILIAHAESKTDSQYLSALLSHR